MALRPSFRTTASAAFHLTGLLAVAVLMAGGACSRHREPPPPEPDFHVVLLLSAGTPQPVRQALERGVQAVDSDLFAASEVYVAEGGQPLIEALRAAGGKGPDLVFCHVPGQDHVVVEEAAPYEDTQFVTIPGRAVGTNVTGVVFRADGAAYVAGATLGAAAGGPVLLVPAATSLEQFPGVEPGLRAGAAASRQAVEAVTGTDRAVTVIQEGGAGAVFYAGFAPPERLIRAAGEAGIPMAAMSTEGNGGCPSCLGVVVVRMDEAVRRLARERWAGTLEGRVYTYGLGSGVVDFTVRARSLPEPVRTAMEHARSDVLAGIAEIEDLRM